VQFGDAVKSGASFITGINKSEFYSTQLFAFLLTISFIDARIEAVCFKAVLDGLELVLALRTAFRLVHTVTFVTAIHAEGNAN
jgi:hypothetical protein